mmetsp:Transcript_15719/g.24082  ORF Transcript_15719/g.24082 Transcript_15719/m.24082 type:complete len:273 (-) Transcript_15719:28-846(-)
MQTWSTLALIRYIANRRNVRRQRSTLFCRHRNRRGRSHTLLTVIAIVTVRTIFIATLVVVVAAMRLRQLLQQQLLLHLPLLRATLQQINVLRHEIGVALLSLQHPQLLLHAPLLVQHIVEAYFERRILFAQRIVLVGHTRKLFRCLRRQHLHVDELVVVARCAHHWRRLRRVLIAVRVRMLMLVVVAVDHHRVHRVSIFVRGSCAHFNVLQRLARFVVLVDVFGHRVRRLEMTRWRIKIMIFSGWRIDCVLFKWRRFGCNHADRLRYHSKSK